MGRLAAEVVQGQGVALVVSQGVVAQHVADGSLTLLENFLVAKLFDRVQ